MEQGKQPLVSVVIPTYNSEKTIERTLDSVINQSYKSLEILVIDDGSKDGTISVLRNYMKEDSRINIITKENNRGVADSRNIGIKKSSGKYVAFLDGDDVWQENKLIKQIKFMEENNSHFTYTNYIVVDEISNQRVGLQKTPKEISYQSMLIGNMIGCSTVIFNKDYVGEVKIPLLKKRNDMALWLKILKKTKKGHRVNEGLTFYYKRENSLSSGNKKELLKYHYQVYNDSEKFGTIKSLFFVSCNVVNLFYKKIFYFEKYTN